MAARRETAQAEGLRVVLYVRVSSDPGGLEKGVDRQEQDCRALAAALGWRVVRVFRENDTSAYKQKTITLPTGERVRRVVRPMFREMLQLLARRGADAMIAYDLDRAVRDPRDLEDLIDTKVLAGFQVKSTTGSLRLENDADIAMARVLVAMANKSSADTARRVKRASQQQAEDGRWHDGRAPFGYRMEASTLIPVPEDAAMIREAADRVLAGESFYRIVRDWNEAGVPSPKGTKWQTTALRQMLQNPAIAGTRTYRPLLDDGTLSKESVAETVGNWEPILDRDTFEKLAGVIEVRGEAHRVRAKDRPVKRLYPFSGLVRCSGCGGVMRKRQDNYSCQNPERGVCARQINFEQTTAVVTAAILDAYARPDLLARLSGATQMSEEAKHVQKQLATDRAGLTRLDDDHYDGVVDRATWLRQRSRLQDRISKNQALLEEASPTLQVAAFDVTTVVEQWHQKSPAWQNQAARLVLDRVIVHGHPAGMGSTTNRRKNESIAEHEARHSRFRAEIMARRIELVWAR
ncbi:recombinase family protein [Microbacterium lacticum]